MFYHWLSLLNTTKTKQLEDENGNGNRNLFIRKPLATFLFMFSFLTKWGGLGGLRPPSLGPGIIIHVVSVWFNLWPRLIFTPMLHFYMSLVHDATNTRRART